MKFPDKLTEIMQKRGITAKDISKQSNISVQKVRTFQNGTSLPNLYQTNVLSKIFGIDFELLINPSKKALAPVERKTTASKFRTVESISKPGKADKKTADNVPIIPVGGKCTFNGCSKEATENCHYTGWEQSVFGKGMSKKVSNLFVADLCHEHHIYFDQPKERKSERMSSEFKTCILLSIKRKVDRGNIIFKK